MIKYIIMKQFYILCIAAILMTGCAGRSKKETVPSEKTS